MPSCLLILLDIMPSSIAINKPLVACPLLRDRESFQSDSRPKTAPLDSNAFGPTSVPLEDILRGGRKRAAMALSRNIDRTKSVFLNVFIVILNDLSGQPIAPMLTMLIKNPTDRLGKNIEAVPKQYIESVGADERNSDLIGGHFNAKGN